MSRYADEQYDVYLEHKRTAAREHACDACKLPIGKQQVYFDIRCVYEQNVIRIKRCIRCQAMHEYLRTLSDDMWPDEKLNCGEEFEQHWGYKPPEWLQELAFWQPGEKLPAREPCTHLMFNRYLNPSCCWHGWLRTHPALWRRCQHVVVFARENHQEPCS